VPSVAAVLERCELLPRLKRWMVEVGVKVGIVSSGIELSTGLVGVVGVGAGVSVEIGVALETASVGVAVGVVVAAGAIVSEKFPAVPWEETAGRAAGVTLPDWPGVQRP
jgi:hypothetical protein